MRQCFASISPAGWHPAKRRVGPVASSDPVSHAPRTRSVRRRDEARPIMPHSSVDGRAVRGPFDAHRVQCAPSTVALRSTELKFRKIALGVLVAVVVAATAAWFSLDKETRGLLATLPTNRDLLFWSEPQRDAAFRALDRLPILAKARAVPPGGTPVPLPPGPPLQLALDVDAYMTGQRSAALVVLHDGKLRLERYGLGFDSGGRWTSFSVAKSISSTLVGAAIRDGHIRSMDDKVSDYIAQMKGSAYDDVSIRQLLTMTSGIRWNEDYADPNSDVARFNNHQPEEGVDALVSYLRRLPREAPPGTRWHYSTGETNLVGILVSEATSSRSRPTCPKRCGCRPAWSSRPPGSSAAPDGKSAAAASRPQRATSPVSACSS